MELIWEELGPNLEDLFKMGRSGVVASLVAASERLHVNESKVCILVAFSIICRFVCSCVFEILNQFFASET